MAIDLLYNRVKKQKSEILINYAFPFDCIPPQIMNESTTTLDAYASYCHQLMTGLKGEAVAARFSFMHLAAFGGAGIEVLCDLMKFASAQGYYTVLDLPGIQNVDEAAMFTQLLWQAGSSYRCDSVVLSGYPGSDILKVFLPYCDAHKKDLFVIARTPNKSASELQDLLCGSRTVHQAVADYANRSGTAIIGKYGYSQVGILTSATAGDSVKTLRMKYPQLFMIIDGIDASGGNAKNCSYGFDRLGHGAIVCLGKSVASAWQGAPENTDYIQPALAEVKKTKKRLERYITIL